MKEKITLNNIAKILILVHLTINLVGKLLISYLKFPNAINYLLDVILIGLLITIAIYVYRNFKEIKNKLLIICLPIILLLLVSTISAIKGNTPILLFIWHLRNFYRYYIFLVAIIFFFKLQDIRKILNICFVLLCVHTILCIIQFLEFNDSFHSDYINGIFGKAKGYNSYALLLILINYIYYTIEFLSDSKKYRYRYIIMLILCSITSAISELKFFYYISILLNGIIILLFLRRRSLKKLIITMVATIIMILVSIVILGIIYPWFANFVFDTSQIMPYLNEISYGSEQLEYIKVEQDEFTINIPSINRISGFRIIKEYFLKNIEDFLLGIGAGNAEYSSSNKLTSEVYNTYGQIGYINFTYSHIFLELGLLGLCIYIFQYIWYGAIGMKIFLKTKNNKDLIAMSILFSIFCITSIIYNQSLRKEDGYFMFLFLAIPFIINLQKSKQ